VRLDQPLHREAVPRPADGAQDEGESDGLHGAVVFVHYAWCWLREIRDEQIRDDAGGPYGAVTAENDVGDAQPIATHLVSDHE
jgi:hypothetical protein